MEYNHAMEALPIPPPLRPSPSAAEEILSLEFLNRELSWLEFNRRVLHEAIDERTPLLERIAFLGIFSSNLDEFFMKRVGGFKRQIAAEIVTKTPDGLSAAQQLAAIRSSVIPLLVQQAACYSLMLRPSLAQNGIHLLQWKELTDKEQLFAERYFKTNVFPVLTPLAVDPGHPFPFISNLSTSLGVRLRHPGREEDLFARIKVPEVLQRWIRLDSDNSASQYRFVSLQDLICQNLSTLFPNMVVMNVMLFRITRNADVERDEEDADDLLEMIEEELRQRRFAQVVRLEHGINPDPWMLQFLMRELELEESDVYEMPGDLEYSGLRPIADLPIPKLRMEPWVSVVPSPLNDEQANIFDIIRYNDILVHHPYESFSASVERFIRTAADDPKVVAIKMTVYRTGDDSTFINSLIRAAQSGKQVVCLVEVKARFDEQRNIYWAQALEKAGVHVVYGIVGLKTHMKTALVVRQDTDGLRCYAHVGTGNYNVQTARQYTDLGLFTCRKDLNEDMVGLFNYLTGRSLKCEYNKLMVAPLNLKEQFLSMIERESTHQLAGKPAHIIAKMNSLQDREICQALYRASQAGLRIDLIVRGLCCLRPGVTKLSENIRVISVLGRFLEHSRIFYFRNGAMDPVDGGFFIGSADWMYRNLLKRIEAVAPLEERALKEKCWEILQVMLNDQRQAWEMQSDGSYVQRKQRTDGSSNPVTGTHQVLMNLTRQRAGTNAEHSKMVGGTLSPAK